jgi:hypothetical protein
LRTSLLKASAKLSPTSIAIANEITFEFADNQNKALCAKNQQPLGREKR